MISGCADAGYSSRLQAVSKRGSHPSDPAPRGRALVERPGSPWRMTDACGSLRGDDFVDSYAALVVHWVGGCWVLQGRCPASTNRDQRSPEPPRRSVVSRVSARCPEGKQKISTRLVWVSQTTGLIVHPLFIFAGPSGHVTRVRSPHRKAAGRVPFRTRPGGIVPPGSPPGNDPPSCEGYA